MASKSNLSVVIDIGTSKIAALAGLKNEEGKVEILGMAQAPSKGVKRGAVFNIDDVAASVNMVISEIESQTGEEVQEVVVSFAGQSMKMAEYHGYRYTSEGVVTKSDMEALYNEAGNVNVDQNYKVLHVIPQSFLVDEEIADLSPVGITGRKLEARYKIIIVPESQLTNIKKVFDKVGIGVEEIILSPLAISEAVLTEDEKDIGAIVLDIGGGTTKLAIFRDNVLVYTDLLPFGGNVVTSDIKEGCSILVKWAEQLKVKYGQALGDFADDQKVVTIPAFNGWEAKEISFKSLAFIIQARLEEIIDTLFKLVEKAGIDVQVGYGTVLTGGTANMNNIISLVKYRTGTDARKAFPVFYPVNRRKDFQTHEYLTALGLLKLALSKTTVLSGKEKEKEKEKQKKQKRKKEGTGYSLKKVIQGVFDYIDDDNEDVALK